MQLSDQVCSLELSKRLKELSVKQESYFYWCNFDLQWTLFHPKTREGDMQGPSDLWLLNDLQNRELACSAFTVAELGEILRKFDIENTNHLEIDAYNTYDYFNIVLKPTRAIDFQSIYVKDYKEADARARMLIYLLENKLMDLKNE
jgi:hypothetical protein